ncbi:MAG TPA: hypothetical protein VJ729_06730 [Nitrososphaeraceae archaeon]|jgi:hypothetical protein|nr:hypothetical protein [Nitrososphaeraceae archaeon]
MEFASVIDVGKYRGALALKIVATSPGLHNVEVTFWDAWFTADR